MSEQLLAEVVKRLEYDVHCIDEWDTKQLEEIAEQIAAVRNVAAQVAALTEQRDALLAACKAVEWVDVNHDGHAYCPGCRRWHSTYTAPELRTHHEVCQLAAAIAQGEAKE